MTAIDIETAAPPLDDTAEGSTRCLNPLGVDGEIAVPHGFRLDMDGVYKEPLPDAKNPQPVWVCSRLIVAAETRNVGGEAWGRLLIVEDRDCRRHQWAMPMEMLAGDGAPYREQLLSLGLEIAPGRVARDALHEYIARARPKAKARCVDRVGWHEGMFVLPGGAIGLEIGERVLFQSAARPDHAFGTRGTLASWRDNVAKFASGNSRLLLACCAAFAAPLLKPVGQESGGFHPRGPSSTGKTTALIVAGSVWGGGRMGYVSRWRATDNGLEGVAVAHCDALLCLDELSQVTPVAAGQAAFMLANGGGKHRANRRGDARPVAAWRLLFLSTGEISLAEKIAEDGKTRKITAGQEVRVVDLPADAGAGLGVFEHLHGFQSGDEFARQLKAAAAEHYGIAAREFVAIVARDPVAVAQAIRGFSAEFLKEYCPTGADGQVTRVAARFALVAAAGELAAKLCVLPWMPGEATSGVGRCFNDWLAARGGTGPAEIMNGIRQVIDTLQAHGTSRFEEWGAHLLQRTDRRLGWRKRNENGKWDYYVTTAGWQEMTQGYDRNALARAMIERGILRPGADGKSSVSLAPPGHTRMRLYHVPAEALSHAAA